MSKLEYTNFCSAPDAISTLFSLPHSTPNLLLPRYFPSAPQNLSTRSLLITNRRPPLDLRQRLHRPPLKLIERRLVDIHRKHHPLPAVTVGRAHPLLAVEEARLVRRKGVVEGTQVRHVVGVEVVEVGVDVGALELGAGRVEGRLGQRVVLAQEVEVHAAALRDLQDRRVERQRGAAADDDGLDGGVRARGDGASRRLRGGEGGRDGEGEDSGEGLHCGVDIYT